MAASILRSSGNTLQNYPIATGAVRSPPSTCTSRGMAASAAGRRCGGHPWCRGGMSAPATLTPPSPGRRRRPRAAPPLRARATSAACTTARGPRMAERRGRGALSQDTTFTNPVMVVGKHQTRRWQVRPSCRSGICSHRTARPPTGRPAPRGLETLVRARSGETRPARWGLCPARWMATLRGPDSTTKPRSRQDRIPRIISSAAARLLGM
mmetsp:Transcript_143249/g.445263  ORF Transcript_143249/g.445263 Transcript_143249/m.445263 type:complete len:210 (-) Transcript_143249:2446-3075(-)